MAGLRHLYSALRRRRHLYPAPTGGPLGACIKKLLGDARAAKQVHGTQVLAAQHRWMQADRTELAKLQRRGMCCGGLSLSLFFFLWSLGAGIEAEAPTAEPSFLSAPVCYTTAAFCAGLAALSAMFVLVVRHAKATRHDQQALAERSSVDDLLLLLLFLLLLFLLIFFLFEIPHMLSNYFF
jgi:hypothetical protein